jgi:hypothetical protein
VEGLEKNADEFHDADVLPMCQVWYQIFYFSVDVKYKQMNISMQNFPCSDVICCSSYREHFTSHDFIFLTGHSSSLDS